LLGERRERYGLSVDFRKRDGNGVDERMVVEVDVLIGNFSDGVGFIGF